MKQKAEANSQLQKMKTSPLPSRAPSKPNECTNQPDNYFCTPIDPNAPYKHTLPESLQLTEAKFEGKLQGCDSVEKYLAMDYFINEGNANRGALLSYMYGGEFNSNIVAIEECLGGNKYKTLAGDESSATVGDVVKGFAEGTKVINITEQH